jgi:cytochrome c peroxidase
MKMIIIFCLGVLLGPVRLVPGLARFVGAGVALAQGEDGGGDGGGGGGGGEDGTQLVDQEEEGGAEAQIGERLFLETRFAQYFYANAPDVNAVLATGDPVLATSATTGDPLPGPFATQSMNCRTCHLVDEQRLTPRGGNRTYADFARRSPVPAREDGATTAVRNSPALVGASPPGGKGALFHFDGEFPTLVDLVEATLTGRNFGWLPSERAVAVRHVADVIRNDDGSGSLAREFGGSYRLILRGRSIAIPEELELPRHFRIDVDRASDEQILRAVARLIAAYVKSLEFANDDGEFEGSPFDVFLDRNHLPRRRKPWESLRGFSRRVRRHLGYERSGFQFVRGGPGGPSFTLHDQPFRFAREELEGLKIFLREPRKGSTRTSGVGNCLACHPLPRFTDFRAHNTGIAQRGYDAVHGEGSFLGLPVPDLATRNADPVAYLPASRGFPDGLGPFRRIPSLERPGEADLGMWNVYANPFFPARRHQRRLMQAICRAMGRARCRQVRTDQAAMLEAAIGLFKTPGLRDLGHSAPYLHDGSADTLEDVLRSYVRMSEQARAGQVRNAAPELAAMRLGEEDVAPLAAFLRALNEDYE